MNGETYPAGKPAKTSRNFGKNTLTWKMYQQLFYMDEKFYPYILRVSSKGRAINLAMGMNTCNIQDAREQGKPDDVIFLSAKAKEDSEGWYVEISTNYRRLRLSKPNLELEGLLMQVEAQTQQFEEKQEEQPVKTQMESIIDKYVFGE